MAPEGADPREGRMIEAINEFVAAHANSPWLLPIVFGLCTLDGFFPPLPSESVVVAMAAVSVSAGEPSLIALGVVAALGAFVGDNVAYAIGRYGGLTKLQDSPIPRIRRAVAWADRELNKRGAVIIMVARYVPIGRVAVNVTAGATRFPHTRFMLFDLIAAITWAGYSIGIGAAAGRWVERNPLLGAAFAVVLALLIGWLADHLVRRFTRSKVAA